MNNFSDSLKVKSKNKFSKIKRLNKLADFLDSKFTIPFTSIKFGYDTLIGLIPGVGDVLTSLISLYIVFESAFAGASYKTVIKMITNIVLDSVIGSIPILGDIFDIGFKSNTRNINLLKKELNNLEEAEDINISSISINKSTKKKLLIIFILVITFLILTLLLIIYLILKIFAFIF